MTNTVTPTVESYDPYSPEVMADPHAFYRLLRDESPVHYLPQYDAYVLTRFEDAQEMLAVSDNTFIGSDGTIPGRDVMLKTHRGVARETVLTPLDPHTRLGSPTYELLRKPVMKPLRPGAVASLADVIRDLANERLDLLVPRGRFDLVQEYGGIVAAGVQCYLFRLPFSEAKHVLDAVNAASMNDPSVGGMRQSSAWTRLHELLLGVVRTRREEGNDGSWAVGDGLFEVRVDERELTDDEIASVLLNILVGGTETVPKVVAHGLWELQQRPDQWAAVAADVEVNARVAFREMARLCAPAQWFARTVHKPVTIAGTDFAVGQRVLYSPASAGRDEREYGDTADEFIWDREIPRLLSFGHGQHFCAGFHLANLEASILIAEFMRRVSDFEVVEEEIVRHPSSFQWGYNELPIRIVATV